MRRLSLRIACLALTVLAVGGQGAAAGAAARIVSTSPSITEVLFALGLGDKVVGVSRFCRYPPRAAGLPKIGTFLQPDPELIARLRPDLVVVHAGPHEIARRLSSLGIRVATVDRGTLKSVYSSIRTIGASAGAAGRAEMLVADIEKGLDRVRAAVAGRSPRKVLIIVGRRSGTLSDLVAVGKGSYLSDIASMAGGTNVLADEGLPEYPRISMETVIRLAPDVIVDAGDMGDSSEALAQRRVEAEALWRTQARLPAVRNNGIHAVTSEAFVVPGPRVVEVAETFAEWLHGVRLR